MYGTLACNLDREDEAQDLHVLLLFSEQKQKYGDGPPCAGSHI